MRKGSVQGMELHVDWREFTNSEEEQRLAVLDARIERKKLLLNDVVQEKQRIMMRAIRRKRRAEGKE